MVVVELLADHGDLPSEIWLIARMPSRACQANVGFCLCAGTWAQGGEAMGIDPAGAIRYFGARKQIREIHFRSVSSPFPHFHETHVDSGYCDMYKVMRAQADVKFNGIAHLDHPVPMVGGNRTYEAFAMGFMKAMRQRAQADAA